MEQVTLVAPAIHCEGCAASIRRSLGKLAGVKDVVVNVSDRTVTISYEAGEVTLAALRERLELAGFPTQ